MVPILDESSGPPDSSFADTESDADATLDAGSDGDGDRDRSSPARAAAAYYEDHYKVVIENVADIDRVAILRTLKREFWGFPRLVGWGEHWHGHGSGGGKGKGNGYAPYHPRPQPHQEGQHQASHQPQESVGDRGAADEGGRAYCYRAVPSAAINGCFLGAINTTLNLLEKHYMDR